MSTADMAMLLIHEHTSPDSFQAISLREKIVALVF